MSAKEARAETSGAQSQAAPTSEAAHALKQEFAAGTLWHQAEILGNPKRGENLDARVCERE